MNDTDGTTHATTRRSVLRTGAATAGVALATVVAGCGDDEGGATDEDDDGTAGADGGDDGTGGDAEPAGDDEPADDGDDDADGEDPDDEASFAAVLADDPSIPGHEEADSDGTGEAELEATEDGELEFELEYEDLEGEVEGIHVHGDGAADGGYLVRLFEAEGTDGADDAILVDEPMPAEEGEIEGTITDGDVNPDGDYDGEVEDVEALVEALEDLEPGESGGVINVHTEHDPDSELAGEVLAD